jgi:hypothetical protein
MNAEILIETVKTLMAPGKGLVAMDESKAVATKRSPRSA